VSARWLDVRFCPHNGLIADIAPCPKSATCGSKGRLHFALWALQRNANVAADPHIRLCYGLT